MVSVKRVVYTCSLCEEGGDAVVCHRMVLRRESSLLARGRLMVSKAKSATSSSQLMDEVDGDCTPIVSADALPKLDFSHVGQCVCVICVVCVCVCDFCGVCLCCCFLICGCANMCVCVL